MFYLQGKNVLNTKILSHHFQPINSLHSPILNSAASRIFQGMRLSLNIKILNFQVDFSREIQPRSSTRGIWVGIEIILIIIRFLSTPPNFFWNYSHYYHQIFYQPHTIFTEIILVIIKFSSTPPNFYWNFSHYYQIFINPTQFLLKSFSLLSNFYPIFMDQQPLEFPSQGSVLGDFCQVWERQRSSSGGNRE